MSWVKLSTSILTDPDIVGLTPEAFRTYVNGLAYCGENLTDGRITPKGLRVLRAESTAELVDCGLWLEDGDDYVVRNYLVHQQSRAQVEEAREAARQRQARKRKSSHAVSHDEVPAKSRRDIERSHAVSHDEVPLQNPDEIPDEEDLPLDAQPTNDARPKAERISDAEWNRWWAQYPRKVGKARARGSYERARRKGASADELFVGVTRSIAAWADEGRSHDKVPHPTTWLNEGRWEDDYSVASLRAVASAVKPRESSWEREQRVRAAAEREIEETEARWKAEGR